MEALPPIGQITAERMAEMVQFLSDLASEARTAAVRWVESADSNLCIYTYGDDPAPDTDELTINEIQNAVIGITQIQLAEPLSPSVEPVETGEPGETYFAGDPELGMMLQLPMEFLGIAVDPMTGQPVQAEPMPLPKMLAEQLKQQAMSGMVPGLDENAIVTVDDQLCSDVLQAVFDLKWAGAWTDMFAASNLLANNCEGQKFGLYEWDPDEKRHKQRNVSIRQVYIDPECEDVKDANFAGIDLVYDADEAARLYPDLAEIIREKAQANRNPTRVDSNTEFGGDQDRKWERPHVTLRIFWVRNQPMPMSEQEAMEGGHVEVRDVPTGEMQPAVDELGLLSETPVLRQGWFAAGQTGGEELSPGAEGWPTRRAIRQLTMIEDVKEIVDDRECEHYDIPILHNVCIPVPGKPWGMGLPEKLKGLQRANNRTWRAIVEHIDYYKHPVGSMPASVYEELKARYGKAYISPGMTLIFSDQLWQITGGKPNVFHDPPALPPAMPAVQGMLKQTLTELSGHQDVLQGRAPSGVKSGRALEVLQGAGVGPLQFMAFRTGQTVKRLALLQLHAIKRWMSAEDVGRIYSKLPPWLLAKAWERVGAVKWDVSVEMSDGAARQQKLAMDLQLLGSGAISMETLRERNGIDHRLEEDRIRQAAMKQMQLAAQMVPAQGQQEQGQQQKQEGDQAA